MVLEDVRLDAANGVGGVNEERAVLRMCTFEIKVLEDRAKVASPNPGRTPIMDLKLELLPVPVTDVDRAKAFYADQLGFAVDVDNQPMEGIRVVQLTPPGSACSIMVGTGITRSEPGSLQGPQLVVDDIEAAREELAGRGVDVSPVQHFEEDGLVDGKGGRWNSFVFFSDPDGNGWVLQERPGADD